MATDGIPDLKTLTTEQAQARLDDLFVRPNDAGPDVELHLIGVEKLPRDPRAKEQDGDRPFSLLFRGPHDPVLTQGMHDLENEALPLRGLFLVPVGREEDGYRYEAVFT
jgi:hypothetical protein